MFPRRPAAKAPTSSVIASFTLLAAASIAPLHLTCAAQTLSFTRAANTSTASPSTVPPTAWAQQCAAREALVISHPNSFLRYRMHTVDEKGDQVRDEIETPEGSVARLILRDGHPLTPEQDQAERDRLNELLNSPSNFTRHVKSEQSNKKMGMDLLKLMPDAMLWSYAPSQPPPPTDPVSASHFVVLDFTPNPKWNAPTIPAEALTGLAGRIWIDPDTQQMLHIEGSLVKAVNIGWGVVAHLYPGATVSLNQTRATDDRWIADHVLEQLNVRALMVKSIRQRLVYDTSNYQPVASMTYQQAIKLLLDTPLPTR